MTRRVAQMIRTQYKRRTTITVSRDGNFTIGGSPAIEVGLDAGSIISHNELFIKQLKLIKRKCIERKQLQVDFALYKEVMAELALIGGSVYQTLGDTFGLAWEQQSAHSHPMQLTITTRQFPLLWECLFQGAWNSADVDDFWGLRHQILRRPVGLYGSRDILEQPNDLLFCHYAGLKKANHELEAIQTRLGNQHCSVVVYDQEPYEVALGEPNQLFDKLSRPQGWDMCHFAVHGKLSTGQNPLKAYLEFTRDTKKFLVYLYELNAASSRKFAAHKSPIVFLNACKTASNLDALLEGVSFPRAFIHWGASAVIATACDIPDSFAEAFASKFYDYLTDRQNGDLISISDCLNRTRRYFIEEYQNPLGLAYLLYANNDVSVRW